MAKTCYIFGAGDYGAQTCPAIAPDAFVIAADGGFDQLARWGLRPHLAVGDFDSLGRVPEGVDVVRHPPEKDDTDMMLAVREGLARGCRRFLLYGGLGGRLDHTLGNLQLLAWMARQGCAPFLIGPDAALSAVHSGALTFSPGHRGMLSLFAWGEKAEGVTLTGLKYPLTDGVFTCDCPLGVSNEFLGQTAVVSVKHGTILAHWTPEDGAPLPVHGPNP